MEALYTYFYKTPIGYLCIEANDDVVHGINFLDGIEHPPEAKVPEKYPVVLEQILKELDAYFSGRQLVFETPFDQNGTVFQKEVWSRLVQIPFGKTISYLDLAKQLGDTKVIRAAASANGKNHLAIVVPCHRVIGSKNDLVGYAGGLWRKRWLLEHEQKFTHGVQTLF